MKKENTICEKCKKDKKDTRFESYCECFICDSCLAKLKEKDYEK